MFRNDDFAWLRLELGRELATPRAVFEALARPRCPLNRRDVLPILIVTRTVPTMHGIKDPKLRLPCGVQDFQHVRNAVSGFGYRFDAIPYLASL